MFLSYFRAATGGICVETQEESRMLRDLRLELPEDAVVAEFTAPVGPLIQVKFVQKENRIIRVKEPLIKEGGLEAVYKWLGAAPGRVAVVYDAHMLMNNPGTWRTLINQLPQIRSPEGDGNAGLVVFVAPGFDFTHFNPLRGIIPVLQYATPDRDSLRTIANTISALPDGREGEMVVDALCGLGADVAEQVCAENLVAHKKWHPATLNEARRRVLRRGGLEIWSPVTELGGLGGLKGHIETELLPWVHDQTLAIRRILAVGIPGTGKSFFTRWLAHRLGAECARLSFSAMKGSLVGQSEANLRNAFRTIDAMSKESPLVVVLDEIDKVSSTGNDSGVSSGIWNETLVWLQESKSLAIVVATLNDLKALDPAMESRFASRLFFDLPSVAERREVITLHYNRVGMLSLDTVQLLADITEGYSSRELSEAIVPAIARLSRRTPTPAIVNSVVVDTTPSSKTQAAHLEKMRNAASSLRRANDPDDGTFTVR